MSASMIAIKCLAYSCHSHSAHPQYCGETWLLGNLAWSFSILRLCPRVFDRAKYRCRSLKDKIASKEIGSKDSLHNHSDGKLYTAIGQGDLRSAGFVRAIVIDVPTEFA